MSDMPTHAELALQVDGHDRDLREMRPKIAQHATHIKNCADATMVRRQSIAELRQLRAEFASEQAATLASATSILKSKAEVIDEIRETQKLDAHVKRELLKSKKERDRVVKRIAVWAGTIVAVGEVARLMWPSLVAAWSRVLG